MLYARKSRAAERAEVDLEHVDELAAPNVLGHRCDNPLCQRIGSEHLVVSSPQENRREWGIRRGLAGSPLGDPRGPRERARILRDLLRADPNLVATELAQFRARYGEQLPLW